MLFNEYQEPLSQRLGQLIETYLETLPDEAGQPAADPLKTTVALMHIFHEIQHSSDRFRALHDFCVEAVYEDLGGKLQEFAKGNGMSLEKTIQDVLLKSLIPGGEFQVQVSSFQKDHIPATFHKIRVYVIDFHTYDGEEWSLTPQAKKYKVTQEHFDAMNEVLMLFFNHPVHFMMDEPHYLDDFHEAMQYALERQLQAILQNTYLLEHGWEQDWQAHSPLTGLLESAFALHSGRTAIPLHLPVAQDTLAQLKRYLKLPALGNVHQTLNEHLRQAAHSHPEHYRIALNRMLQEVFRKHFLIEMHSGFQVVVQMPDEQGLYRVKVNIPDLVQYGLTEQYREALVWMLEYVFNYAGDLDLPTNVWREET